MFVALVSVVIVDIDRRRCRLIDVVGHFWGLQFGFGFDDDLKHD